MSDRIDLHVHTPVDAEFQRRVTLRLDEILTQLVNIGLKESRIMATVLSVNQLVQDLFDESNTIAARVEAQNARIAELTLQLENGDPVTQADLDAISAALTPLSERLRSLGANPIVPIPPPVTPPADEPVVDNPSA